MSSVIAGQVLDETGVPVQGANVSITSDIDTYGGQSGLPVWETPP